MEIFKLFGSILIDDSEADKSLSKMDKKTKSFSEKLSKGIKTAAKWGAGLAAGAGAAVGGMVALGVKVGNTADAILDLNSITGMSTDSVQEWRKVAEVAGIGADSMANASMKLTKNLDAMSSKTHKGNEALGKLGMSLSDIEGMSADERMNVLTEALAGVEDKTERAKIGTDLFGGSWKEIAPAVDLGTEAMQKAKDSANIISNEDLVKANDFRITVENMKDQVGFFATKISIALLPMLQSAFDWFQGKMPLIESITDKAFKAIEIAFTTVSNFINDQVIPRFQDLWAWIEPHLPLVQQFFEGAFNKIVEVLEIFTGIVTNTLLPALLSLWEWIEPNLPQIKQFFEDAFITIKDLIDDVIDSVGWLADKLNEHWGIVQPIIIAYAALIATQLIVQWTKAGAQALISAGKQVSAWVMTQVAALKAVAIHVATAVIFVARWVFMGAQALIQAGRMALAWLIAMGPVGWVIATIIALVALIVANWDTIVSATQWLGDKLSEIWTTSVDWIMDKVDSLVAFFGGLKDKFSEKARGMFDGMKDALKSALNWIISKWNSFSLSVKVPSNLLTEGLGIAGKGFSIDTPNIPMLAKGARNFQGDMAIVGEKGPELVTGLRGANVYSNPETKDILGGGRVEALLVELINAVKEGKSIVLDGREVARGTYPHIKEYDEKYTRNNLRARGLT